jgi:DNA polymerase III epsilon subunit-like protein
MYILGIDTETTGLGPGAKIVELAAILVDSTSFKTVDSLAVRVNPQIPIDAGATKIHGITDEDVANEPTIEQVFSESPFLKWLNDVNVVFGHNLKFDIRMLGSQLFENKRVLDTLPLLRFQFRDWHNHKLQTAVRLLELEQREAHAALGDIESSCDILRYFSLNFGYSLQDLLDFRNNAEQNLRKKLLETILL